MLQGVLETEGSMETQFNMHVGAMVTTFQHSTLTTGPSTA